MLFRSVCSESSASFSFSADTAKGVKQIDCTVRHAAKNATAVLLCFMCIIITRARVKDKRSQIVLLDFSYGALGTSVENSTKTIKNCWHICRYLSYFHAMI